MPQIGGFEILIIVVIAILVIGPKDFPLVLRKIGSWIGSTKRYFTDIQQSVTKLDESVDEKISIEEKYSEKPKDENK
jgi:sec-independent protein translocase protein TatB